MTNRILKGVFFMVLFCFALGVQAQSDMQVERKMKNKTPEEKAMAVTKRMAKKLGLDENQKAQVLDINTQYAQKRAANPDMQKEQRKELRQSQEAQLQNVLTAEQFEKMQAIKKEKAEKRKARKAEAGSQEKMSRG